MFASVAVSGVAAIACGYHTYKQSFGSLQRFADQALHIDFFRKAYNINPVSLPLSVPSPLELLIQPQVVKQKAVSYDLYDTLITRDLPTPESIFDIVEAISGIKGFSEARQRSGKLYCGSSCLGDIEEIYRHLALDSAILSRPDIDLAEIRKVEWKLELEHSVLIQSNVNKLLAVRDANIIIVSDMYYSAEQLREILLHLNFPRLEEIVIFSSRSGKRDGWIWPVLNEIYTVLSHTGDNYSSDVTNVIRSKLVGSAVYSQMAHSPTAGETLMFNEKEPSAKLFGSMMRRLSMKNPYTFEKDREKFFWYRTHASYTIPLFWFFINSIKEVLNKYPLLNRIAAVSRDCILLEPLIQKFLLNDRNTLIQNDGAERNIGVVRFEMSRKLAIKQMKNPNPDYIAYLRETLGEDMQNKTLVIDINGTYKSVTNIVNKYLGGTVPKAHFLSIQNGSILPRVRESLSAAIPGIDTNVVEMMNATLWGSVVDWIGSRSEPFGGPVRTTCEYDDERINVTRQAILEDSIDVLSSGLFNDMPRTRTMSALLEKATCTLGTELQHVDDQVILQSLIYPGRTPQSQRYFELCLLFTRILSPYHNRTSKNPLTLIDVSSTTRKDQTILPWARFMKQRISVLQPESEFLAELGIITVNKFQEVESIVTKYQKSVANILALYIMDTGPEDQQTGTTPLIEDFSLIAAWELTEGQGLNKGILYTFSKNVARKAVPADEEIDLNELPEVPNHSRMVC